MTDEIVLYQPNDQLSIEVKLENDTVWLTQQQMAMLFNTTRNNITLHIGNIFKEGELDKDSVCKESLLTAALRNHAYGYKSREGIKRDDLKG
ncbi:MAG: hypothetical protein IJ834_02095 [Paludibacteraceae bacterium]|nr:hypothetical protein [Paludibacteraceae bacterium]